MIQIRKNFVALILSCNAMIASAEGCPEWLDHNMKQLHKESTKNLCQLTAESPVLIINTASYCGFTPQFKQLEAIHQKYSHRGLRVIGVASNSFKQEAKSEEKIAEICYKNFGVSFTMFAPVDVTGEKAHPLFAYLAESSSSPKWNFNKYLISQNRDTVIHFQSHELPDEKSIESMFNQKTLN